MGESEGKKYDKGKLKWVKAPWLLFEKIVESMMKNPDFRWDLLPFEPIEKVVEILTYGEKKYQANNWQMVDSDRYVSALIRHLLADTVKEEDYDQESGLLHTSHMHCNAMFLSWQKLQELKEKKNEKVL